MTGAASPVAELLLVFARLSLTAFGGPAGHIAVFREELVRRRGWLGDEEFLDLVALTSLLPGPNSTELAMEIGRRRAGRSGLLAAGAGFIVPAALVVLAVAWLYGSYGQLSVVAAAFAGVMPVVVALLVVTVVGLARALAPTPVLLLGAVLFGIAALAGVDELLLLGAGAVLGILRRPGRPVAGPVAAIGVPAAPALGGAVSLVPADLPTLFAVFLKVGALLFGSGYVLVAFLRNDLVHGLGWLSERELLDAIAVGQATPGPLFTTATFVGYALAGVFGAAVATVAIFLPAFVLVALLGPRLPRLAARHGIRAVLDGLRAASVGLIAAVTIAIATGSIAPRGQIDVPALLVAGAATIALATRIAGPTMVVALGAAVGVTRFLVGA